METAVAQPVVFKDADVTLGAIFNGAERGGSTALKTSAPVIGHFFASWGVPIATGVLALVSLWDHDIEKRRIAHEFDAEIGAMTGKAASKVTKADMEKVAEDNPVIAEALERSRSKRNLSIGVIIAGGIAAAGLAFLALHAGIITAGLLGAAGFVTGALHLGGAATAIGLGSIAGSIPEMLVAGLGAGLGFLGIEMPLHKWGEKKLGIKEPELDEIKRNPARQAELSVSSQITYLSELQAKKKKVSQEQVLQVFASANPRLAQQIEARFGAPLESLNPEGKAEAVRQFGDTYAIADLTDDINNRHMRVQELAFTVSGQTSGIRSVGDIQRSNVRLQQRIRELEQKLDAKDYSIRAAAEQQQDNEWQRRISARRQAARAAKAAGLSV